MSSVRNELALANAQELINVRGYSSYSRVSLPCQTYVAFAPFQHTENKRQVLCKVCDQTIHLSF